MALNALQYVPIFQQALDQQIIAESTTGWMEANAGQVKYSGGNEVKIPSIATQGLADYDRDKGFTQGSVSMTYQTHRLTQDRARTFLLDRMDVDETNFVANASAVMAEFQRTHVIPEIDCYRYSKIYALLAAKSRVNTTGYTPASATIFSQLINDINTVQDAVGENTPLVISISFAAAQQLDMADKIEKRLLLSDFKAGAISTKVRHLDDIPLLRVPGSRLKTEYIFRDGETTGQEAGGAVAAEDAKQINWLITAKTAPIAVSKTEKIRIFDPDLFQGADAWKIDYRKYHDLWLKDSAYDACWANIGV